MKVTTLLRMSRIDEWFRVSGHLMTDHEACVTSAPLHTYLPWLKTQACGCPDSMTPFTRMLNLGGEPNVNRVRERTRMRLGKNYNEQVNNSTPVR